MSETAIEYLELSMFDLRKCRSGRWMRERDGRKVEWKTKWYEYRRTVYFDGFDVVKLFRF